MSEDEEDYMSDAFLAKCIPEDVRPGLKRVSYKISYELFLAIFFWNIVNVSRYYLCYYVRYFYSALISLN